MVALFESTAEYYEKYRPAYPEEALTHALKAFNVSDQDNILDLGCGTGQLALPLRKKGPRLYAVDPDVDMLSLGMRAEAKRDVSGIRWMRGSDSDLAGFGLPELKLCVMGSSFHWTDREKLLAFLDTRIVESGGVALLNSGGSVWSLNSDWALAIREVLTILLGADRRAGKGTYEHPKARHQDVLKGSAFSHVETYQYPFSVELSVEEVIGLQLSTSYASPAQLGGKVDLFREKVSTELLKIEPSGVLTITFDCELILAFRGLR